ncbi:MAG: Stp1/IreP family PP2C-type Ser/Thr phosphatase [Deltaproteobacteria bacterium]|nr:Stp1/IreP family PP2C-type Ser/Thr phosphatase [Deltaproteobacteria bacterium]
MSDESGNTGEGESEDSALSELKNRLAPAVGGLSDVGRVRELNEDNWFWAPLDEELVLYAVADGMGGHDRGEVASQVAVEQLFVAARAGLATLTTREIPALRDMLREAMQTANRAVVTAGEENDSNMGTTLTCSLVYKDSDAVVANVGDSRAYLVREGRLKPISQDHSLVAYLVQLGELTAEEARTHPSGNILVRSIGSMPEVEVDVYHVEVQRGDRIMICSDGLWGEISDADIQTLMKDNPLPQDACQALVDRANDEGGRDNTTLIVVEVGGAE